MKLKGKYNEISVHASTVDQKAVAQILSLANNPLYEGTRIQIMPDVHAASGTVVGMTMTPVPEALETSLIGSDIGCGMLVCELDPSCKPEGEEDFQKLDRLVHHAAVEPQGEDGFGTLGGGNHFIELAQGIDETVFLIIHSGSRLFGKKVFQSFPAVVEGETRKAYLNQVKEGVEFAKKSRESMAARICQGMGWPIQNLWHTVHNYIDEQGVIRKGSISAASGEKMIIPINMAEGSLITRGKGNPEWNWSAPHGAGRLYSRGKAKEVIEMKDFQEAMQGIYSTTVGESILSEAPQAYKGMSEIAGLIVDTAEILDVAVPLYNFKRG